MPRVPVYPLAQDLREILAPLRSQVAVNANMEGAHHFYEVNIFNYDKLIITFEDGRPPFVRPERYRRGWGTPAFLKRGVSVLAIKPKVCDWYSNPQLAEDLARLRPFLNRFRERATYGASMGGFGALTYADLLGASRVVAIAPQSTYREENGILETRFPDTVNWNHDHAHADAAQGCRNVADVCLFYDRFHQMDSWHAERIQGPNVRRFSVPYAGHAAAVNMHAVGLLEPLVDLLVTGNFDATRFYAGYRRRRELASYIAVLRERAKSHPSVQARLRRILLEDPPPPAPLDEGVFVEATEDDLGPRGRAPGQGAR